MIRPFLLALLAASAAAQTPPRLGAARALVAEVAAVDGPRVGEPAPTFEAVTVSRDTVRLGELRGRHVLLEFWGTWCGPCVAYAPRLAALHARYPRDRFEIVGVALDGAEAVRQFTEARGLGWPQIVEPNRNGRPVVDLYGVRAYPTTFLIDPDGVVVYRDSGYGGGLEAALAEALDRP